jgi:hypothetical protein
MANENYCLDGAGFGGAYCDQRVREMRQNQTRQQRVSAAGTVVLLAATLGIQPLLRAGTEDKPADYKVVAQASLGGSRVTDMFLRASRTGKTYLYVTREDRTLSVYDVSLGTEPKETEELSLTKKAEPLRIHAAGPDTAIVSDAPEPSRQLSILNFTDEAHPKVARYFPEVEAFAIDSKTTTLYVAQHGKLSIVQFERPITRDAAIWEQFFEAR